jgi:AbrB family looped-hinge helix DNA binding protein
MAKVTSKLQLTIPKAVADQYGISPGDEVDWVPAGDAIRVVPASARSSRLGLKEPLALSDQATAPQRRRQDIPTAEKVRLLKQLLQRGGNGRQAGSRARRSKTRAERERGWTREELYTRGSSR